MDVKELRGRVGAILAAEEREPADWSEVERLTGELEHHLRAEPSCNCPEVVNHFLDDADIRARDEAYGARQRDEVRRFVQTGDYDDGTPISLWTCAILIALCAALLLWFVL